VWPFAKKPLNGATKPRPPVLTILAVLFALPGSLYAVWQVADLRHLGERAAADAERAEKAAKDIKDSLAAAKLSAESLKSQAATSAEAAKSYSEIAKTAGEQVAVLKTSADAAQIIAQTSQRQLALAAAEAADQRITRLMPTEAHVEHIDAGERARFFMTMDVTGRTGGPSWAFSQVEIADPQGDPPRSATCAEVKQRVNAQPLARIATISVEMARGLTESDVKAVREGLNVVRAWGLICWDDGSRSSKPMPSIEFCQDARADGRAFNCTKGGTRLGVR